MKVDILMYPGSPLRSYWSSSSTRSNSDAVETSPQTFALALTKLESDRYRKIIPADCLDWLKSSHDSNNVSSFIAENNKLSYWVQKSILKPEVQSQRSDNLKYFLSVVEVRYFMPERINSSLVTILSQECRKLGNFSSTCALFAGLASSSITRLKRTSTLDKASAKFFRQVENLMSPDKNFQAYRKALNASHEPCVPWLRAWCPIFVNPGVCV